MILRYGRQVAAFMGNGAVIKSAALLLVVILLPAHVWSFARLNYGSTHDFVDDGFRGGGVCDECHSAGGTSPENRIFRWGPGGSTDAVLCATKCHLSGSMPGDPAWALVTGKTPPPLGHPTPVGPARCFDSVRGCHGDRASGTLYADCLGCHNDAYMSSTFAITSNYDSQVGASGIDKFFGFAQYKPYTDSPGTILSSHSITYDEGKDLSLPVNNECLKCHGAVAAQYHPGGSDTELPNKTPLLVYPDDTSSNTMGTGITLTNEAAPDYRELEEFCLSCHDGNADAGGADIQLSGVNVPPVPRYDYNEGYAAENDNYATATPYFALSNTSTANFMAENYFEQNGHGKDKGLSGNDMNLGCLARGETGQELMGCHTAHGSISYYNLDYYHYPTVIDTADELGTDLCMSCHDGSGTYGFSGNHSGFHTGFSDTLLHVGATSSAVTWYHEEFSDPPNNTIRSSMPRKAPVYTGTELRILPFFTGPGADLESGRVYNGGSGSTPVNIASTPTVICITCHDPHGTSERYDIYDDTLTPVQQSTVAMPRKFLKDFYYDDPLCMECHVE
ncbi:MAG: hypothetical protein C0609_06895 [Deltaproteobacteria bacterium]|nr:MAG: hypothetical protein C0609_06895 [Deltaproteobacteria bacterium]